MLCVPSGWLKGRGVTDCNHILSMSLKKTDTVDLGAAPWGRMHPIAGTQALPTYDLTDEIVSIGRNAECTICINDKRLSGKHCSITKEEKTITLTDLSTNGTFLAAKKVGKGHHVQVHSSN